MSRRGFSLLELFVVIAILLIVAAILFPVFTRTHPGNAGRSVCQSNLKQIALGMKAYAQDYDEKYPLLRGNAIPNDPGYGWAGAIQSYIKSTQILQCPRDSHSPTNATGSNGFTDYWYNNHLNAAEERYLGYPSNTIMLGDGNDGADVADATYNLASLPPSWVTDPSKPAFRHLDGANYAFADGHVRWLKPVVPVIAPVSNDVFTFAVK